MIRLLFAIPLMIHGLIHLMGFSKEWNLGPPSMLKHKTTIPLTMTAAKTAGLLWLFACCLLMGTAVLYLVQKDWYWMVGIGGVVLSQGLIMLYWRDAKYATILNVIILVVLILAGAQSKFDKRRRQRSFGNASCIGFIRKLIFTPDRSSAGRTEMANGIWRF
ncbi:hypothetical protein [Chryseolinea soli]|nr:hypothetical protein [Chryseolinea soli]